MSHEWPIAAQGQQQPAPELPLLGDGLGFYDHVELIKGGGALEAFARRRAGQILHKGHTAESDLAKPPGKLGREALWRITAFLEIMGPMRMNMPPQRRTELMDRVEAAGASLIALWDRLQVEVDEE